MGITIHYAVKIRTKNVVLRVLQDARAMAEQAGMKVYDIKEMGLGIHPHQGCESLRLDFFKWKEVKAREGWDYCKEVMSDYEKVLHDEDYVCADFTKTQYAGYRVHVMVAEFLRRIASSCTLAYISDEADYYESRDAEKTRQEFDESTEAINKIATVLKGAFGKDRVYASIDHVEGA